MRTNVLNFQTFESKLKMLITINQDKTIHFKSFNAIIYEKPNIRKKKLIILLYLENGYVRYC